MKAVASSLYVVCAALSVFALGLHASEEAQRGATRKEDEPLPLPRWSQEEIQAFRRNLPSLNDVGVLPPGTATPADINELLLAPVASGPRLDGQFNSADSELSARLQPERMRYFLPEFILGSETNQATPQPGPTSVSALQEVTPEFLAAASRALAGEYLIDPEHWMSEVHHQDMTHFLEFHARDARIKLHVLILAHDQKIAEGRSLDAIASGALLRKDSCLLVYPLGEPWRARLLLSKSIHEAASPAFLGEMVEACLREALQNSQEHDQLRAYAVHLSTRLFWLQRALGGASNTPANSKQSALSEVLAEERAGQISPSADLSATLGVGVLGLTGVGLAGFLLQRFRRQRQTRTQNCVWVLPEQETLPRLGGAFTGGGGATIRF